jgi:hypothetical protein
MPDSNGWHDGSGKRIAILLIDTLGIFNTPSRIFLGDVVLSTGSFFFPLNCPLHPEPAHDDDPHGKEQLD